MKPDFSMAGKGILAVLMAMLLHGCASGQEQKEGQAGGAQQVLTLQAPAQKAVPETGTVTFIGTATVIIRYAGFTILTDPNFLHMGDHVHLGYGLTAKRLTNPAIDLDQLPPIDLIVLSHMHGDHFDQLVQEKLDRNIPIVTTPQAAGQLADMGFKARYPLATWETLQVRKGDASLKITAMPGRHGPPVAYRLLPQVMGSMLEFSARGNQTDYRMYISGDTLVYDDIHDIPKRYPDIDLALLHLGGTRILGVMKVTMDDKDGVKMLQIIAPHHAIPIHFNDYDVFKSPLSDFEKEVRRAELQSRITYLKHGESYQFQPKSGNR
ncbi:MBL fold metallo-hydrolase [Noviherbaspirillum massiliense]|uniref:MBL fold metallo-hydrolase n=1 Tax=Noviherbaspirillum massiliense TaxID=1465823 RepID=UPI0002EE9259|nr:MBL fold metallo-hydrolase [Noviherbaspirillum massiliense]